MSVGLPIRNLIVVGLVLLVGIMLGLTVAPKIRGSANAAPMPAAGSQPTSTAPAPVTAAPAKTLSADQVMAQINASQVDMQRQAVTEHQAFASRFAAERPDPSWAGAAEARMLAASKGDQIAQLQAEPRALEIHCKASMCRIQADFASRSSADDWFTLFSLNGSDMPQSSYSYSMNRDGSARLTVYGLSRGSIVSPGRPGNGPPNARPN